MNPVWDQQIADELDNTSQTVEQLMADFKVGKDGKNGKKAENMLKDFGKTEKQL